MDEFIRCAVVLASKVQELAECGRILWGDEGGGLDAPVILGLVEQVENGPPDDKPKAKGVTRNE